MTLTPAQEWWTPGQIAESGLPDLPTTRQGVDAYAANRNWRAATKFARRRSGKGGGWEYSWKLFPNAAQRALIKQAIAPKAVAAKARDEVWTWYEGLPQAVKDKAEARLMVIQKVEALEGSIGRFLAVEQIAAIDDVGARTIWSWFKMIEGIAAHDRLAYLAPRNRAAEKRPRAKECAPEFFEVLKSDYLRLEAPPFTDCYRRAARVAKDKGLETLPERTMRRHLDARVSRVTQVLARQGVEAVKRLFPSQTRDKTCLHALQAVNADFHKFDVFVRWPSVGGEPGVVTRPQMATFQDIYSGRILAWRIDQTPNSTAVQLCAGDMIETWGIPEHIVLDNGREFAAKAITGGAATRFRFKVKEDDIPGLFTALGCKIHWATPYHGQAKPIERAFRDMCQSIAKDPRFAGAYTGNTVMAKPENYGSRAVELEDFLRVVAEGIDEHNAREGRQSEVAFNRSFNAVFDESYAGAPIKKATEAQRRFWLMGAEGLRADTKTGMIRFQRNEFWEPWLSEFAGTRVVIRFDPADLWSGVHVYTQDNAYLGHAGCRQKVGFLDMDEARITARARAAWIKAQKAEVAAHRIYKASELGQMLDGLSKTPAPAVEAKVVKPVFGKASPEATARPSGSPPIDASTFDRIQSSVVANLDAARAGKPAPAAGETARDRFRRALDIERRLEAGEPVTRDQERWLSVFQNTSEYRSERLIWDDFGDAIFG
ncbi:MAG: Mu transposase C-terminal domain-containing protein [Tabrizicola sp.]|jgi:transposase InsO family protein|nr:Mu transposase C-terminal domain-containing protein [Tabrizicola sp.]